MVDTGYARAMENVLDILKHTNEEDVKKIPPKFMLFLEENKLKNYKPNIDYKEDVRKMHLDEDTQALLGIIYLNFWANEEEKKQFKSRIRKNEEQYQVQLRERYNIDNLLKASKEEREKEEKQSQDLVVIKRENILKKFLNKIKKFFLRRGEN